jgi:hypothetical protein
MYKVLFKTSDIKVEALATLRTSFMSKTSPINSPTIKGEDVTTVIAMDMDEVFRLGSILALGGLKKEQLISREVL